MNEKRTLLNLSRLCSRSNRAFRDGTYSLGVFFRSDVRVERTLFCPALHLGAPVNSSTEPIRIQRKRTKGWKMPENTVYVGRPTVYGNPWKVGEPGYADSSPEYVKVLFEMHRAAVIKKRDLAKLRGKNLACWCPLDQPCHADVLLQIANFVDRETPTHGGDPAPVPEKEVAPK